MGLPTTISDNVSSIYTSPKSIQHGGGDVVCDLDEECIDQYTPYGQRPETYIVPLLFAIIFVVGVLGNGTLIVIFLRHRAMRNIPNTWVYHFLFIYMLSHRHTQTSHTRDCGVHLWVVNEWFFFFFLFEIIWQMTECDGYVSNGCVIKYIMSRMENCELETRYKIAFESLMDLCVRLLTGETTQYKLSLNSFNFMRCEYLNRNLSKLYHMYYMACTNSDSG